jgi:hypothetical protein
VCGRGEGGALPSLTPVGQALHVYRGHLGAQTRSLWDLATGVLQPFTEASYFRLAQASPEGEGTLPEGEGTLREGGS